MALCKVMIIGNLGSDPEMRYTPNNRAVTQFNVAVNQSTKNQQTGEWVEETDWFRVSVWGDRGERIAEQLRKGNKVFVEGRFRTREFDGRDGQKRTALEITADSVVNLEKRPRDDEGSFGGGGDFERSSGSGSGSGSGGGSGGGADRGQGGGQGGSGGGADRGQGGGQSGGQSGGQGGSGGGADRASGPAGPSGGPVRPTRGPADDTDLDDLPF